MQAIVTTPRHVNRLALGIVPFWRFQLAPAVVEQQACLALIWRYPSAAGPGEVICAWAPIPMASPDKTGLDEVQRLASVAVTTDDEEKDVQRAQEAVNMWRNAARGVKEATLTSCCQDVERMVRGYWAVRRWVVEETNTPVTLDFPVGTIRLRP